MNLFKFPPVAELLSQIDERIDVIEKFTKELNITNNIVSSDGSGKGFNLITTWRELYSEINKLWLADMSIPVITINKIQGLKLLVISELVAIFFLNNGDKRDDGLLKNVSALFEDANEVYGVMAIEDRCDLLIKEMENKIN